jgi:hypothetical protein
MRNISIRQSLSAIHHKEKSMKIAKTVSVALLAGVTAMAFALPASSAPLAMSQASLANSAPSAIQTVQYHHRHWRHHGYRHHHHGGGAGALIGGLAAGALIGGAIAAGQANAASQQHAAYCAQRYRSYDPGSNTYLAYDGNRYPCR